MVESLTRFVDASALMVTVLTAVATLATVLQWAVGGRRVRLSVGALRSVGSPIAGLRRLLGAHEYDRSIFTAMMRASLRLVFCNVLALIALVGFVLQATVDGEVSLSRSLGFIVLAAAVSELVGFGLRYWDWFVSIRMDAEELRREQRENEGDPWVRNAQREAALA